MVKLIKLLLGLTLLLVLAVAVTAIAALLYFDPNEHKDFIVGHVEKATGRSFAISGKITLSYYPWLGVEAAGITLGNAKGFGDTPFLHAERVALRIKTMPLLRKHYELDTFRLHGLQLHLARNKEGVTNWSDLGGAGAAEKQKPEGALPFAAVVLGGVDVKDGQISWQDEMTGQTINVSDLNMSTGELTYGAPINLAATMKAGANRPALNGDLKLNGTLNYNLDTGIYALKPIDLVAKLSGKSVPGGATDLIFKSAIESNLKEDTARIEDLGLEVLGTTVKGGLVATHVKSGKPQVTGELAIKGKDLVPLLKLIESPAAKDFERLDDRSFDVRFNLDTDLQSGRVQLPKFEASLLGASIHGNVEANNIQSGTPSAKGMLKATGPDLPALLQLAGQFETGKKPKLGEYGRRLARSPDRAFDIAVEFDADLKSGNIQVPTLAAKTLGFSVNGQLVAKNMNSDKGKVDGKFSLQGDKPADVLAALDQNALADVLQIVSVDAGVSGTGGEITLQPLRVKATFAGKQIPNSPADVTLNADTQFNLKKQTLVMKNMSLQGLGVNVSGDVSASKVQTDTPAITGRIDAQGSDLALLFKLAGIEPLATQLAALDNRSFDIKTGLDADLGQGTVKVSNLDARLLGATIQGQVDASNIRSKSPSARGKLKATGPDLPALMQVIGQFQGMDSPLKNYGERLSQLADKSFDVTAEFDADPDKGNYHVPTLAAKTLGINLNGQLDAGAINSNNGKVDGKVSLQGEKLSGVLAAMGQGALGEVLQSVKMDAGVKGQGGDIALSPLQIKATFAGKQIPNSPVDLTLSADTSANLDKQTLSINKLALQGLGLNVTGNLSANRIKDNPDFSGDLTVAEFNLRQLAQQMNQKLPETADKNVLSKVALKTTFAGTKDSLTVKEFTAQVDESKLNGNFSINHFTRPDIKFGLGIDNINADRYLPPSAKDKPVTPEAAAAGAASELPLDTLRSLQISGDMQASQFIISNAKLNNIKLSLRAKDGDIRIDPASAELYQGKYQGSVALDVRGKMPIIMVNSKLATVHLEPLLKDYLQQPQSSLVGTADLSFEQLTGSGMNAAQIKSTLTGKGELKVTDGVLRGVDIRKALEQVEIMLESKTPGKVQAEGNTPFKELTATLDIKSGIVTNNDLLMLAEGFKVKQHDENMLANLNDDTIKYDMKVEVEESRTTRGEKTYNIGGYKLPVRCRGQLRAPDCKPDVADIATLLYQKVGKDILKEALGIKPKKSSATGTGTGQQPAPAEQQVAPKQQTTTRPAGSTPQSAPAPQPATTSQPAPESQTAPAETQPPATPKKKTPEEQMQEDLKKAIKDLIN